MKIVFTLACFFLFLKCTHAQIPVISFSAVDASCNVADGSIDITVNDGTPPYAYAWSNGETTEDVDSLLPGFYTITVTDSLGASAIFQDIPVAGEQVDIIAFFDVVYSTCNLPNASIDFTASGGAEPYQFIWSNGVTTEDITNIPAGLYYVTITDANGCSSWNGTEILTTPPVDITLSATASCGDSAGSIALVVNAGTFPTTFIWNTSDSTQDLSGLDSGLYIVTVTDALGCTASDSAFVQHRNPPVACIDSITSPCSCTVPYTVELKSCSQPSAGLTFNWMIFGGNPLTPPQAPLQTVVYDTPGEFPVWLTVTDTMGCSNTIGYNDLVQITPGEPMNIFGPDTAVAASTISFMAFNLDSYDWSISPQTGVLYNHDSLSTFSVFVQYAGLYQVCLTTFVHNACGVCEQDTCFTLVVVDSLVGVSDVSSNAGFAVYPNPASDEVTFSTRDRRAEAFRVRLFDAQGNEVVLPAKMTGNKLIADTTSLANGLYVYAVESSDGRTLARGKLALQ